MNLIIHTEKYFWNFIKSNRNQIVFTIFRLNWNSKRSVRFKINQKMVNTIWFRFDLIKFRNDFSVYMYTSEQVLYVYMIFIQSEIRASRFFDNKTNIHSGPGVLYCQSGKVIYCLQKLHEKLASLGTMEAELRAPLNPSIA